MVRLVGELLVAEGPAQHWHLEERGDVGDGLVQNGVLVHARVGVVGGAADDAVRPRAPEVLGLQEAVLRRVVVLLQGGHGADARHGVVLYARVPGGVPHAVGRELLRRQRVPPLVGVPRHVETEGHALPKRDGDEVRGRPVGPRLLRAVDHRQVQGLLVLPAPEPGGGQRDLQGGQRGAQVRHARRARGPWQPGVGAVHGHVQGQAGAARLVPVALLAGVPAHRVAGLRGQAGAVHDLAPAVEARERPRHGQRSRGVGDGVGVVAARVGGLRGGVEARAPVGLGADGAGAGAREAGDLQLAPVVGVPQLHARATLEHVADLEAGGGVGRARARLPNVRDHVRCYGTSRRAATAVAHA
mmetsp:Transcript_45553/g.145286  ORF Transcript_45553/g.145286 Transcript_45553/m.145286 type:complete len:357 (-) Transcript_45553:117-1187(-)